MKRTATGVRYAVPSAVPSVPWQPDPEPAPQSARGSAGCAESTADAERPSTPTRRHKLSDDDRAAIRADWASGNWSQHDLAYVYGVSRPTIGATVRGLRRGSTAERTETTATEQES